jgi:hypothetical protein
VVAFGPDKLQSATDVASVEATLVKALGAAAAAGRFDVVAQLAKELEARRLAGAGVDVARERAGEARTDEVKRRAPRRL